MKLANALSQRAELQTCIRQLEERLNNNAQVQEGEESAEDPMELLRELDEDYAQLEALIARINRTNSVTLVFFHKVSTTLLLMLPTHLFAAGSTGLPA